MTTNCRLSTAALIVCMLAPQWTGTLAASDEQSAAATVAAGDQPASATERPRSTGEPSRFLLTTKMLGATGPLGAAGAPVWSRTFTFVPDESSAFAQRGWYGGRGRGGRHFGAKAVALGAVASIAGAAVLVYANRPECSANHSAAGCGYGTKVIGGAVLSAGAVGLVVGALTWR